MIPAKLRFTVRKMFENSGTEDFQPNRRTGSLNVRALHTVGHNDRLFKRRFETAGVDSAVVIVLDVSGSMFNKDMPNSRMNHAVQCTYALLDTLSKAGVATSVVTFSGRVSVLKPWDMPYRKSKPLLECVNPHGSTNDYKALSFAHRMLYGRDEQRKVAFVITDGGGDNDACKEQALTGERLGVTTIGVGIMEDVSYIFKNAVTVNKLEDLGTVAFDKLKLAA